MGAIHREFRIEDHTLLLKSIVWFLLMLDKLHVIT